MVMQLQVSGEYVDAYEAFIAKADCVGPIDHLSLYDQLSLLCS
jgi:hypothetical protein